MNHNKSDRPGRKTPGADPTAAERLEAYIAADQVVAFEPGFPDKEFPYVLCSMWGVVPTNELFVRLTNGEVSFIDCVRSPLDVPAMGDRRFGMDVEDANAAGALADQIWKRHKHQLIRPRT
ncbi:MAG: hypothetical protein RL091_2970 [Verrucomicrobiota bacterium]|jgi:hypothetical protein